MRTAVVLALAVVCCAVAGVAALDKPKRASTKVVPRIVKAGAIHPKADVWYDAPKGSHKQQVLAPTTNGAAAAVPASMPVLRNTPNSAACAGRNGACGDKTACRGTLVTGLCPGSSVCCVAAAAAPASSTNSAACAARSGVCGASSACASATGSLVTGLCPGSSVCCVPKAATPTPGPAAPLTFSKSYLLGKFNPATHPDFQKIPGDTRYIRKDTYAAYQLMNNAARNEIGMSLPILSATRTFDDQKAIWERKWTTDPKYKNVAGSVNRALAIMSYSSMPSTSQHHWGCTFDLVSLEPSYFTGSAAGKKLDAWFRANAARFGFCRPFSPKPPRVDGYNEEQWHVAYKPVLKPLLAAYRQQIAYSDISGFSGSETAQQIGAIEKFVYGISPDCTN